MNTTPSYSEMGLAILLVLSTAFQASLCAVPKKYFSAPSLLFRIADIMQSSHTGIGSRAEEFESTGRSTTDYASFPVEKVAILKITLLSTFRMLRLRP